jgi:hypothetical protein
MRRRALLISAAAVVVAVLAALVIQERTAAYPDVAPKDLLFRPDQLPSLASSQWNEDTNLSDGDSVSRRWHADGEGTFSETVERHSTVLAARYWHWAADPRTNWREDAPDKVKDYRLESKVRADRTLLFCAKAVQADTGDAIECWLWEYRAQYGQYIVDLTWMASRENPVPQAAFERSIVDIDGAFVSALQARR